MVLLSLIFFCILFSIVYKSLSEDHTSGHRPPYRSSYTPGYMDYDDDEDFDDDLDDYSDSETRAARGDRNYFTDDPSYNYNSYYAQLADDAMMDDRDAMDELRGEFGEGD